MLLRLAFPAGRPYNEGMICRALCSVDAEKRWSRPTVGNRWFYATSTAVRENGADTVSFSLTTEIPMADEKSVVIVLLEKTLDEFPSLGRVLLFLGAILVPPSVSVFTIWALGLAPRVKVAHWAWPATWGIALFFAAFADRCWETRDPDELLFPSEPLAPYKRLHRRKCICAVACCLSSFAFFLLPLLYAYLSWVRAGE